MNLISALCLVVAVVCGWYNYNRGHNLILIPAAIAVFVGLFCAVKAIKAKKGVVLAWLLAIANGLLTVITVFVAVIVVISELL